MTVRSVSVKPMRNRRQKRVEARVFDESGPLVAVWFNQPWLARQLGEGAQVLLHGKLRQRNQFWVTEHELLGAEAPVHTVGLVPVHPATQGMSPQRLRELAWKAYPRMFDSVDAAPRSAARRGGAARPPGGARRRALPGPRGGRARRPPAARVRGAVPAPARRGRPPARAPRGPARAAARGARRGGRPLALVAAVRAHGRPAEGDRGDRRRPGARAPDAAPADGGGGKRQAQPYDALVLTPTGFRRMEDIQVGDEVVNPTGETTHVTGVYPQGVRDVCASDSPTAQASSATSAHLWQVRTSAARHRGDTPKVKPSDMSASSQENAHRTRRPAPRARRAPPRGSRPRTIPPRTLDELCQRTRVRSTTADARTHRFRLKHLPAGASCDKSGTAPYDCNIVGEKPRARRRQRSHDVKAGDERSLVQGYESAQAAPRLSARAGLAQRHAVRSRSAIRWGCDA